MFARLADEFQMPFIGMNRIARMTRFRYLVLCLIFGSLQLGCEGTTSTPSGATGDNYSSKQSLDEVKAKLFPIADTGKFGGSELMGVDTSLTAAGKPELVQKLKGLRLSANENEGNKKIAQEVIDAL